jgi:hypothetical protein
MSRLGLLIRYLIFCTFFAVGGTAMVVSFLVKPELTDYLQSRECSKGPGGTMKNSRILSTNTSLRLS